MHVHRRHLVLMACRKFGVTTPDTEAKRERGERRGREAESGAGTRGGNRRAKDIGSRISPQFQHFFLLLLLLSPPARTLSTSYCAFITRCPNVRRWWEGGDNGSSPGFKL